MRKEHVQYIEEAQRRHETPESTPERCFLDYNTFMTVRDLTIKKYFGTDLTLPII